MRSVTVTTCDLCGFVYEDVAVDALAGIVRGFGARYREVLLDTAGPEGNRDDSAARTRPSPTTWSALEYACHVRDVLLVQRDRAVAALVADRPTFPPMYRDERVELAHYDSQVSKSWPARSRWPPTCSPWCSAA